MKVESWVWLLILWAAVVGGEIIKTYSLHITLTLKIAKSETAGKVDSPLARLYVSMTQVLAVSMEIRPSVP